MKKMFFSEYFGFKHPKTLLVIPSQRTVLFKIAVPLWKGQEEKNIFCRFFMAFQKNSEVFELFFCSIIKRELIDRQGVIYFRLFTVFIINHFYIDKASDLYTPGN
jgi:hypothetical protein